jgi:hypothetical protein
MKAKTFFGGNAALKNFSEATSVSFHASKPEIKKPPVPKGNSNRRV